MFLNQKTHRTANALALLIGQMREVATKCVQEGSEEELEVNHALSMIDRVAVSNRSASRYVQSKHYQSLQRMNLGNNLNSLRIAAENVSAAQSVVWKEEQENESIIVGYGILSQVSNLLPKEQLGVVTHLVLEK